MLEQGPVLIAAVSGRALAASARRAGFIPLVADCFGDEDTREIAQAHVRVSLDAARGLNSEELLQALERLARTQAPLGIVYGTGFEDRPQLLARIARQWRLFGNAPDTIARLKDPASFAALCRGCGVPHPPTRTDRPAETGGWVVKRAGGAGGTHVRAPSDRSERSSTIYYQREVTGRSVSPLVLGNGRSAIVLGFSAQWTAPAKSRPFRYGGAVRPADLSPKMTADLTDAVHRLIAAMPLVGLNSFDFMIDGDAFCLLEINPRPGATLDIFEPPQNSLFGLHVAACEGALPAGAPELPDAAAACIVYADREIGSVPAMEWPAWAADRQSAETSVKAGDPFCTVLARASTAGEAQKIVRERAAAILAKLDARLRHEFAAN